MDSKKKVDQSTIQKIAWSACDTFRGVVDPSEYKNYVLVMLFIKYLSDLRKEKKEEYVSQYKGDMDRVERRLKRERFQMPEDATFDRLYNKRNEGNIGEIINKALEKIEDENKQKLDGVFRNIDFNSEHSLGKTKDRNSRLKSLLEDFHNPDLDLRPSRIGNLDIIGNTYEYLISQFASDAGKKGGEFYTPPEVSQLIAKLVEPKEGERICDPACGSGSLLIKVAKEIKDINFSLYGQESNGSTWALCQMNMFLHGIDNARIEWCDTIKSPALIENDSLMKFDIIVANPPFSLKKWGVEEAENDKYNRFHRGLPPKSKGDYAFITHMIETMNEETGRVGVVVPLGVLFRGAAEGRIRTKFIQENLLDAVIGLPDKLFFGTGIPAAILVFKKNRRRKNILFIDASNEYEKGKKQNKLRNEDLDKIYATYKSFTAIEKYSYIAKPEEIKENDYNLNIPRYVDTFEEEEPVDIPATIKEIKTLENELKDVQKKMDNYLNELGIKSEE
ncbi:type I restriction-modification system subunit M [bacterium]|nr:type I restriction-modification system subunit M [bacterium]